MAVNYEELFAPTPGTASGESANRTSFLAGSLRYKNQSQYDDLSEVDLMTQTRNDLLVSGDEQQFIRNELINNANAEVDSVLNTAIQASFNEGVSGALPLARDFVQETDAAIKQVPESGYTDLVRQAVRTLGNVSDVRQEEIVFAKLVGDIATRALEKRGLWDKAVDFGGMMIAPDNYKDKVELTDSYSPGQAFVEELTALRGLPALERMQKLPEFVGRLEKAFDGNEWKWVPELVRLIEEPEEESLADDVLTDVLTAATFPGVPKAFLALNRLARATNNTKLIATLDPELAGKMIAGTLTNPTDEMMRISGLTQQQAALSALGSPQSKLIDNAIVTGRGVPAHTINSVRAETDKINKIMGGLLENLVARQETSLTNEQRAIAGEQSIKKLQDEIAKLKDPYGGNYTVRSFTTTGTSPTGFTVKVDLTNSGGWETNKVYEIPYTRTSAGTFGEVKVGGLRANLGSPDTFLEKMTKGWVSKFSRLLGQQAKTMGVLAKARAEVTSGLKSSQKKELDVLYDKGRRDGVVYTLDQLLGGDNPLRKPLSHDMAAAYFKGQQLEDWTWTFANYMSRRGLEFDGFKGIKVNVTDNITGLPKETTLVGRPEDKLPSGVAKFFDSVTGKSLTRTEAEALMKADPSLKSVFVRGGLKEGKQSYTHAIVPFAKQGDLPLQILSRPVGYIAQMTEFAPYIGFRSVKVSKNGRNELGWEVSHVFDTNEDGAAWLKAQEQTADTQFRLMRSDEAATHPDFKEGYKAMQGDSPFNAFGGLTRGRVSSQPIYYTSENLEREFLSPLEAMDNQLRYIGRHLPINEMKMTAIQEFKNTARGVLSDPKDWTSEILVGGKQGAALRAAQNYLKDLTGLPSRGELSFHSVMLNAADFLEKRLVKAIVPFNKSIRNGVLNMSHTNPIGAVRNATFHALLGSFNPSQLFVQMQGAVAALSLDPIKAPQFMGQYAALRYALYNGEHFADGTWKRLASFAGMQTDELRGLVKQFRDSGIPDAIRSNSDFELAKYGGMIDAGNWKRLVDSSTIFFREGELISRGYSYLFARDKFIGNFKRLPTTLQDQKWMYDETLRLTLNMTAANKAVWQKGIFSIPTQFMQITAKFIENFMLPETLGGTGKFTAAEKTAVLLSSFALYGAAGIPFGKSIKDNVADYVGLPPGSMSPEMAAFINGGMWELNMYLMTGEPVDLSNRFAMASGLQAFFEAWDSGQEDSLKKMLAGAAGSLPPRVLEAMGDMAPRIWSFKDPEVNATKEDILLALSEITDITSSGRNAKQALRWWIEGRITNTVGQTIIELEDDEAARVAVIKAFGFTPQELAQYYDTTRFLKMEEEDWNEHANQMFRWYNNMLVQIEDASSEEELSKLTKQFKVGTGAIVFGLGARDRQEVWERFNRKVANGDAKFKEIMLKAIEHYMEFGETAPGTVTNVRLSEGVEATNGR